MVDRSRTSAGMLVVLLVMIGAACRSESSEAAPAPSAAPPDTADPEPEEPAPEILYLPDAGDVAPRSPERPAMIAPPAPIHRGSRCPPEMVDVGNEYCVDRYEAVLVDARQGRRLSPYYSPRRSDTRRAFERYRGRLGAATARGRTMPIPEPPEWQLREEFSPRAIVLAGETPNGYSSGELARIACDNAGKRLCTEREWVRACRGQQDRQFPYGVSYEAGACNVFREAHPAQLLHGDASIHHDDPRLNAVTASGVALLRPTGSLTRCKSEWGNDAIYDMVGNLDEWVEHAQGMFLGGFFSRGTKEGCSSRITAHPPSYADYSLGVRCCLTPGR